jgi:NAD-dependent dihydropyrimidine dehydrogenase PreA subunit
MKGNLYIPLTEPRLFLYHINLSLKRDIITFIILATLCINRKEVITMSEEIELSVFEDMVYLKHDGKETVITLDSCIDCFVCVESRFGEEVTPMYKEYIDSPDDNEGYHVSTKFKNKPINEVHEKLVSLVRDALDGIKDEDYAIGYKDGSGKSWKEVKREFAHKRIEGNKSLMREIGEWFRDEKTALCKRNNAVYPLGEGAMPSNSYVRNVYKKVVGKCANCGADLDETKETLRSSNRTRVPNRYKCKKCDHTWKGRITG